MHGPARVAGLSNLVAALLDKRPEGDTERGVQRFDVKHDVEVFRGAEVEPGIFHRERRSGAANQDVLAGIVSEVLAEQIEALHHGNVLRISVSAFCTRSSASSPRLSISHSGSTESLYRASAGL